MIISCQLKNYFMQKSVNRILILGVLLWLLPIIMYITKHNVDLTSNVWTKNTRIIFYQYIYSIKTNSIVLIRAISGYLKNVWYLSTKLGLFQNPWALTQYTEAYHFFSKRVLYVTYKISLNLMFWVFPNKMHADPLLTPQFWSGFYGWWVVCEKL